MKKVIGILALLLLVPAVKAGGCYSSLSRSYYSPSYSTGYYTTYPSQSFLYNNGYSYDYNRVVLTPVLLGYSSPPPVNVTINQPQAQTVQPQQAQPAATSQAQAGADRSGEIIALLKSFDERLQKLEQAAGK